MEKKTSFFQRVKDKIENFLPMKAGSFILFLFVLYLIFIVIRVVALNYDSNKDIEAEAEKVNQLREENKYLSYQINYYQTYSYKEKEAREKLGYKAPGENVISLPVDAPEDKTADSGIKPAEVRTPNFDLWVDYFFKK